MEEKKVTMTAENVDGETTTLAANTLIAFAIDEKQEGFVLRSLYFGEPLHYFASAMAKSICKLIEMDCKNPYESSFRMFDIAYRLNEREKEIRDCVPENEQEKANLEFIMSHLEELLS